MPQEVVARIPQGNPDGELGQLLATTKGRPMVVAASTHPGEEEIVLDTHRRLASYFANLLTIIVPRHPQRGEGIAHLVAASGLRGGLRSRGAMPSPDADIYIADTLGEIGLFYRAAPIVFMGGSFATIGGHNPIEAIKLGAATIHGPHVHNWSEIYSALDSAGGAWRADAPVPLMGAKSPKLLNTFALLSTALRPITKGLPVPLAKNCSP